MPMEHHTNRACDMEQQMGKDRGPTLALLFAVALVMFGPLPAVARNYLFWALVCVPVAVLADMLIRTLLSYRIVRLTVARVRRRD